MIAPVLPVGRAPARLDPGADVGDLPALLEPGAAAAMVRAAGLEVGTVTPSYLRLKPGRSALVGYRLTGKRWGSEVTVEAYARTFDGDDARVIAQKWPGDRAVPTPLGPGVTLLPGGRTVLFQFPNDGHLRLLPDVVDAARLRRLLVGVPELDGLRVQARRSTVQPVRWKPERRLVAAATLRLTAGGAGERQRRALHLRWFPDASGASLARVARHLRVSGVPVPDQLGSAAGGHLHVESTLPGRDGAEALLHGALPAEQVIELLAVVQGVRAVPELERAPGMGSSMQGSLRLLTLADPALGALCEPLATAPATVHDVIAPAVVHGDLHLHQLVVSTDGLGLVDLERAGVGDPLVDVAAVVAHAIDLGIRHPDDGDRLDVWAATVVDGALRSSPHRHAALVRLVRAALVERALLAMRQLEPDWQQHAGRLLQRASGAREDVVWEVLHPRPGGTWTGWRRTEHGTIAGSFEPVTATFQDRTSGDDAALPGLAVWAGRGELLSHRPGRRAVVRMEDADGPWFVKLVRPRRAVALLDRHWCMAELAERQRDRVPPSPAVMHADPASGVVALSCLPGRSFHELLVGDQVADRLAAIRSVAGALGGLGEVDVSDVGLPAAADGGDPGSWLELIATHLPGAWVEHHRVHATLPPAPGPSVVLGLVHGDLHDRNVLLDGDHVGWIDLDGLGAGDPAIDVGNLAAHVLLRALQRGDAPEVGRGEASVLLDASGAGVRARAWGARTLFRLACLYRFRRRWTHLPPVLLDEAAAWSSACR